jgi:hypothetical protein
MLVPMCLLLLERPEEPQDALSLAVPPQQLSGIVVNHVVVQSSQHPGGLQQDRIGETWWPRTL